MDVFDDRHLVAGARGHAEIEIDHLPLLGHLQLFDLVELLDAALHLGGFGGVGFEAFDEALLFGEHGLLAGEGGLMIRFADDAFAFVEVIVAGVGDDFASVDFGDLGDDAVHELAVVRGHEQGTGVGLQKLLKPDNAFEVEVVGGLVHQEDVGASQQHPREGDAHLPPAGECADVAIDLVVLEAEPVEDFAGLSFERVAVQVLIFFLDLAKAVEDFVEFAGAVGIFHGVLEGFEFVVEVAQPAAAGDGFVEHGAAGHLLDVLPEVADGELFGQRDIALIGLFFANHHAEEGGFAGTVGAYEPDLFAGV